MPLIALIALFVAFWSPVSPAEGGVGPSGGLDGSDRVLLTMAAIAAVGTTSALIGGLMARRVARRGPSLRDRRRLARVSQWLEILAVAAFGAAVHGAGWPRFVADCLGIKGWILVDEAMVLLPFLLMLLAIWSGLYPAERMLKAAGLRGMHHARLRGYLVLKARQALGMVVPVAVLFALVQDLRAYLVPSGSVGSWSQLAQYAGLGGMILVLSPAFVRLSWPAKSLPPGPLRARLERLARRFGFRYSDILVWDTGGALVNAGVTGALPWFRYVLLTDAMVEHLSPRQIEAVFGHEIGHIAHRHLNYFGLFFLGTMGVMALLGSGIEEHLAIGRPLWVWGDSPTIELIVQGAVAIGFAAAYFLLVFGFLSRRFERQADIFGCRAVSCGLEDCPPHPDVNAMLGAPAGVPEALCPVGIGIFVEALTSVAMLNGLEPRASSWRHGSIARRIAFLRGLEGRPEAERRFQARVRRLRVAIGLALTIALGLAISTGALESLR
ncbi:M48 family metallopeptidase [Tautonia sociabilis]|uniref:Zn-dependent protease with chaperone function n=1 Tax=Tautonia sociabilis TaxID=2080755 RepID=A0A432MQI7_9BACT|nr:M48 family metallopeptidase [Tautonia sociabilis]RUL89258.1 Zn-dependent protease with chaperone function [Tautonia sociabilis]